ncbi:uveal autoantigen with coiled-coil domains and ankyrin repeats [Lampris incognitus]|uniref:uveal autoantigen with coiled-coil domains and ankyrin repeats n=1 Tax=Lampris incognitus TaxID=2546036 RepID=UPI0024B4869E|nr:uveal autoantigen with coiled-coil domains and ankyrin repeats [Lampris incognitus]
MKSLKYRLKKHEVTITNTDWNKYDDRLMKAVDRGEVDKVAAVLSKKGIIPTKLDVEGRSAFHVAATRGHLDCLNLILGHNVDIIATDATGKNALHLASRNGQSLCVQKLLQHNCPVGNVDLQGRTALHDAVMAGCSSSVKLLCDSGASVNASDFDGRTPLVLATQMCHPRICQLLLERGADITLQDKQNKTALILGCEYGCKDAVEVLLRSGADVTAVDGLGHDPYHYARLSKNQELVAMVKSHLDNVNRVKEAAKMEQRKRQQSVEKSEAAEASIRDKIIHDLEKQNESQQESLRKFQQEQRALLDRINMLQQQLTQEKLTVEDSHKEGDYSGQSVIKGKENNLVKQSQSLDSAQNPSPSRSQSRPLELSKASVGWDQTGEVEALRHELDAVRRRQQDAEDETIRLQSALTRKNQECQELAQNRVTIQKQADQQIQELEDALRNVQKRMLDSECKVKQLQAHVVAVKEHLGGQGAEELRAQLQDIKTKYEGASAEVGRVRNRLKQSEKALEEYKSSEGQLAAETERLGQEMRALTAERDQLAEALLEMETQRNEAPAKHGNVVSAEKFDNMKNLLTNAVDEKERQLTELREDYDRVLEEVAELHRELDHWSSHGGKGTVSSEEHQRIRAALEEQNASLKRRLTDVTAKSQALIHDVEEIEEEREILREQVDELNSRIEADFISLKDHEETKSNMIKAMEELEDKLVEASERYGKAEAQVQQLQNERTPLLENITSLQSGNEKRQNEMGNLVSQNADLVKELDLLQKRCEEGERKIAQLTAQTESLNKRIEEEYVPRHQHEQVKMELAAALENAKAEIFKLETKEKESGTELRNVKDGSDKLQEKLEKVLTEMKTDYVSLKDHEAVKVKLSASVVKAESRANDASEKYALAQEETVKLNQELEAQKKELDTIQEAIRSKFIPLTAIAERENAYEVKLKDLTAKLLELEEKYSQEKLVGEHNKREKEKLNMEMVSIQKRLEAAFVTSEKQKGMEEEYKGKIEELILKLVNLEQQYKEVNEQRDELKEHNVLGNTKIQGLQQQLESQLAKLEKYEAEHRNLQNTTEQAEAECHKAKEAQQVEAQKVCSLQKELQGRYGDQAAILQQHTEAKEALEAEVAKLHLALSEEEECSAQRAEDVSALQSELLQATQALEELRDKEDQMSHLKTDNQHLKDEVASLSDRLLNLAEQCKELHREAAQAREGEDRTRTEMETVQEKGHAVEREIRELKKRYDESLSTIGDLQRRIQTSAEQTEVKDKKITELLTDVEGLRQALKGLSQLAYAGNAPNKRQAQHIDTLQAQIKSLQQQLADAERQHRDVVSIYRTHLLSAAQGHMDEDVQAALLQIIRMRQEFVC